MLIGCWGVFDTIIRRWGCWVLRDEGDQYQVEIFPVREWGRPLTPTTLASPDSWCKHDFNHKMTDENDSDDNVLSSVHLRQWISLKGASKKRSNQSGYWLSLESLNRRCVMSSVSSVHLNGNWFLPPTSRSSTGSNSLHERQDCGLSDILERTRCNASLAWLDGPNTGRYIKEIAKTRYSNIPNLLFSPKDKFPWLWWLAGCGAPLIISMVRTDISSSWQMTTINVA